MSRFEYLLNRLRRLEQRIVSGEGPWPPEPGSFSFLLWEALGKPEERRGHMEMYLERAKQFWEDQK